MLKKKVNGKEEESQNTTKCKNKLNYVDLILYINREDAITELQRQLDIVQSETAIHQDQVGNNT